MKPIIPIVLGAGLLAFSRSKGATTPQHQAANPAKIPFTNLTQRLPHHATRRYGQRRLNQITDIVIHHSAGPDTQTPLDIARYHISPNSHLKAGGAPGIAYHFCITPDGHIYQTQDLETISWHVGGHNTKSVGICLIGNFDLHPPTASQYVALQSLIKQLKSQVWTIKVVKPHKAYTNTSCPGRFFDFNFFRSSIGKIYDTISPGREACNDGKFTNTTGRGACSKHGGLKKKRNCPSGGSVDCFAIWFPVSQIQTDPSRFQNRVGDYSEESVQRIIQNYDVNKLDPVTLWRDPKNGKVYILSGHSRYEAHVILKKAKIPARFFEGTEAQAIRYGRVDANRSATPETLIEDIAAFRLDRDGNEVLNVPSMGREALKKKWGRDFNRLDLYSYLSPQGKFLEVLRTDARKQFPYIENKAGWVGYLRKYHGSDKLTNLHENELFDYLFSQKGISITKDEFFQKVNHELTRIDFDPSTPLYLDRAGNRGADARADTAPAQKRLREMAKELEDLRKRRRLANTQAEKGAIDTLSKRLLTEKAQLERGIQQALRSQTSLFGIGKIYSTQPPGKYMCIDKSFTDTRGRGACSYHGGYFINPTSPKKRVPKSRKQPQTKPTVPVKVPVLPGAAPGVEPGIITDWPTLLAFLNRRIKLEITAAEVRQAWEDFKANETRITEDLGNKTKKDLLGLIYQLSGGMLAARGKNEKKGFALRSLLRELKEAFLPRPKRTWSFDEMHTPIEKIVDAQISQWTDEHIDTLRQERAERLAARQAEKAQLEKQAADPQTLEDFQAFFRLKGKGAMTPELTLRYETLVAARQLEQAEKQASQKRKVQAVNNDDIQFSEIIKTKHTRDGHDLFVVQMKERVDRDVYNQLNARAKRLGGYYSAYRRGGAVPGFQFRTEEAAQQFLSLEEVEKAQKERSTEKMKEMAERMEEGAQASLEQDRKMNTARRARQASSAIEDAEQAQRFARTFRNLAEAIDAGKVRFLRKLRNKTELAQLTRLLRMARLAYARHRADTVEKETGSKHQASLAFTEARNAAFSPEMVPFASYPYPYIHKDNLSRIVAFLEKKPGYKMLARRLARHKGRHPHLMYFGSSAIDDVRKIAFAPGLDKAVYLDPLKNSIEEYNRMQRMSLTTIELLRAALLELIPLLGEGLSEEEKQQKEVQQLEARSLRMKIPGYFPTPVNVVQRMVERAEIRPGDSILEPSAGKGNIADTIRQLAPENSQLTVIEFEPFLVDILKKKGHDALQGDFLKHRGKYDKIIMNPPFEKRQDIAHVRHAYSLLKPGGKIVAIMSEGSFSRSQAPDTAFQEWLSDKGHSYRLPEGTFNNNETKTNVRTRLVVIDKPVSINGGIAGTFRIASEIFGVLV